jgi:hypothetical protein
MRGLPAVVLFAGVTGACSGLIDVPGGDPGGAGEDAEPVCLPDAPPQPGRAPLRRLTVTEYDNTVRDPLGDDTAPASRLVDPERGTVNADARAITALLVEQYMAASEEVAARAVEDVDRLLDCDRAALGDDA